jgi:hypothetical protein
MNANTALGAARFAWIKTAAIVFDNRLDTAIALKEQDANLIRMTVACRIGERFLDNPIERHLNRGRQALG